MITCLLLLDSLLAKEPNLQEGKDFVHYGGLNAQNGALL